MLTMEDYNVKDKLLKACRDKDFLLIKEAVEQGADVNMNYGEPLQRLIEEEPFEDESYLWGGSVETHHERSVLKATILRYLIDQGLDVNLYPEDGYDNPVLKTYTFRCPEVTKVLLEAGAKFDVMVDEFESIRDFIEDGYYFYGSQSDNAIGEILDMLNSNAYGKL